MDGWQSGGYLDRVEVAQEGQLEQELPCLVFIFFSSLHKANTYFCLPNKKQVSRRRQNLAHERTLHLSKWADNSSDTEQNDLVWCFLLYLSLLRSSFCGCFQHYLLCHGCL